MRSIISRISLAFKKPEVPQVLTAGNGRRLRSCWENFLPGSRGFLRQGTPSSVLKPAAGKEAAISRRGPVNGHGQLPQSGLELGRTQLEAKLSNPDGAVGISVTHHPERSWLKELAIQNIFIMLVTLPTFHAEIF